MDLDDLPEMPELMIVGPGEMHGSDLEVLGRQVIAHYGDTWVALHSDLIEVLGELLGASDPPYVIPGTGTTCLDMVTMNLFEPGQTVVVPNTGFFGNRLIEIARVHGLTVRELEVEIGAAADPAAVAEAAQGAHGVMVCHVDTSTGVRHPIAEIAAAAHDAGAVCVVDGIASVGGERCDVDAMGIDALVTSTQKGLECPPGLGLIALGRGGRERAAARSAPVPSWYLSLERWDWYRREWGSWHPHPVTMPTSLMLALLSSVRRILANGFDRWVDDRAALSVTLRQGLRDLGLEPVPHVGVESNMVVAVWTDDAARIAKAVLDNGVQISGGLAPLAGKTLRIGLMGRTATPAMVDRVLDLVARALKG